MQRQLENGSTTQSSFFLQHFSHLWSATANWVQLLFFFLQPHPCQCRVSCAVFLCTVCIQICLIFDQISHRGPTPPVGHCALGVIKTCQGRIYGELNTHIAAGIPPTLLAPRTSWKCFHSNHYTSDMATCTATAENSLSLPGSKNTHTGQNLSPHCCPGVEQLTRACG